MKIRIYESKNLDLDTVERMLYQADKQANFFPNRFWILSSSEYKVKDFSEVEESLTKKFKELSVKWTGREAVVNWLLSNQINFEIISHEFLDEELEALGDFDEEEKIKSDQALMN